MGLWSKLFGKQEASAPEPPPAEAVLADVRAGRKVDWDATNAGRDDDEAFALLWQALPLSAAERRVDVIDHLAEFELEPEQQATLLSAATEVGDHLPWVAISVLESCDLAAILSAQGADALAPVGRVLGVLVEAALSAGPAGDILDAESGPAALAAFAEATAEAGATAAELWTLHLARRLVDDERIGVEEEEQGWDEALAAALDRAIAGCLDRPPRGQSEAWKDWLPRQVAEAAPPDAVHALSAARAVGVDIAAAAAGRLSAAPEDAGAWNVALHALDLSAVQDAALPAGVAALQARRMREGELCSLSSQAGCQSCGGPEAAEDEELMVPKALEARLLPLLGVCAQRPGRHGDLVVECLAAPSISLRYNALAVLSRWAPADIDAETWDVLDALRDDSVPQVQEAVLGLLERRPDAT